MCWCYLGAKQKWENTEVKEVMKSIRGGYKGFSVIWHFDFFAKRVYMYYLAGTGIILEKDTVFLDFLFLDDFVLSPVYT